jgi:hypothetical protein
MKSRKSQATRLTTQFHFERGILISLIVNWYPEKNGVRIYERGPEHLITVRDEGQRKRFLLKLEKFLEGEERRGTMDPW